MTTFAQDAEGRRTAARRLLTQPILTATRDPEEFALVRRHATALKSMFATQLGYPLVVESGFARLVKAIPDPAAPPRPARRPTDDTAFTARTYVHLALICAALLAPGVGEQILISALVEQVRADAAEQSINVSDSIGDRRHLVTALALLVGWGVVAETEGSISAWGERRQDEALLTINRPLVAHLLPSPLHHYTSAGESYAAPADDQPRRRLRRRLVEHPVVLRSQLPDDELDVLSRERSDLTRQLAENFGLTLEVRAEGALAYDADGALTDVEFPGTGSRRQAALLLLDELVVALAPDSGATVAVGDVDVPGACATWELVDRLLADLAARHRRSWKSLYADSPDALRTDVIDLLSSLALAMPTDTGLVIFPPAARYRPGVTTTPAEPALFEEHP
ncbi:MAG TPA: TIGR02678 family protein [Jatrophihabitans sp.]|nr:TIGR02678 family protein [Jatrophihabitans sp.]